MSQVFYYAHPGGWTVDLGTQAARLGDYGGYSTKAETGAIGTSTFIIDDPDGTVGHNSDAILGLQEFYVTESDCPPVGSNGIYGQRLYTGYTRERTYRRGTGSRTSLITGVEREIEVALEDPNSVAAFRILNTPSGTLPGTATKASGNTTISGSGTNWTTSLGPNFTISIPGGGGTDILYVDHVVSDTSLVVITAPTHSASGQVVTRIDANRPAETDVQRVQWLLGGYIAFGGISPYLLVTNDAGWIDTSGPVNMDANDYTGQNPADVVHDCALASGKDWWVGFWEATGTLSLWYAKSESSTTYTSPLLISNVLADVDNITTFAPEPDAALVRSPVRTFAGVWYPYSGGNLYVSNATTASNYSWRDGSAPNANVKTLTAATQAANRLLTQDSVEEDRITCRVRVPSAYATGYKPGQRVQAKFSHLPGYSGYSWMRIASLQTMQDEATDKRYTLSMELTPQSVIVCSTSLSTGVTASSLGATTGGSGGSTTWSTSVTPPASGNCIVFGWAQAYDGNVPNVSNPGYGAGMTGLASFDPVAAGLSNTATMVIAEYKSGVTSTLSVGGSCSDGCCAPGDGGWYQAAFAFRTSATAPVQSKLGAWGSTASVTLDATPTVGNLLVVAIGNSSAGLSQSGFTQVASGHTGGPNQPSTTVWAKCVTASDGTTYSMVTGNGIVFASEWELLA